jgi:hypothetical protein
MEKCFSCGRKLSRSPHMVFLADTLSDGQHYSVFVGSDCYRAIVSAGYDGYRPTKGGPIMYASKPAPDESKT